MENKDLKIISGKLSLIIKLMLLKDEDYKKMTASEKISLIDQEDFSAEQIANLLGIPVKTVRNIIPHIKK